MFQTPTLGSAPIFGGCCHVVHQPDELDRQEDKFFAVPGVLSLNGAARGRRFRVEGVFVAPDIPTLNSLTAALIPGVSGSYADGMVRELVDSFGNVWENVILTGDYEPDPEGPYLAAGGGWTLSFKCTLRGLS